MFHNLLNAFTRAIWGLRFMGYNNGTMHFGSQNPSCSNNEQQSDLTGSSVGDDNI